MQANQENEDKDDSEKFNDNRNEKNVPNKNCILSNRSSKVTTKVSKLIYDPQNHATRAIIKSTHTYGHKISSQPISSTILVTESPSQLDNDKILKTSTFKTRDINKFPEKKSNESPDIIINPINKNHEFIKKKLEREKDIEDIQKMLNQINTSCHENVDNQYKNSTSIVDNLPLNQTEKTLKLHNNETETINIPSYEQTELNLDINNTISDNNCNTNQNNMSIPKVHQKNSKNLEENNEKTYLHPSETDLNLRRSQTDMNLKTKFLLSPQKPISSSRTPTTIRTKSSINLFSRDSSKLTLEMEVATKKKSYDPNEARRFMKEQRIKRHQQKVVNKGQTQNQTNNTSGVDKEAIKKRLEDLRKSTLKILEKNVKVKDKQQKLKNIDHKDEKTSNLNTKRSNKTILKTSNSKGILVLEKQPQEKNSETNDKQYLNKKIGLLRKPETEDHSFSVLKDFNINKENFNINMKTPTLLEETSQIDDGFRKITDTVMFKKAPEKSIFENGNNNNLYNNENSSGITKFNEKQINNQENDFELKIPDKKLERKVSLCEKSIQVDPLQQPMYTPTVQNVTKQNGLPYWLKPTPVQYYPYNFIMAVRKKLEAITNPVINNNDNKKYKKNAKKSHKELIKTQETPLTYPKERKEAVRRRIVDEKNFNTNVNDFTEQNIHLNLEKSTKNMNLPIGNIEKIKSNAKDNSGVAHSSKSLSEEITSNFSSISIHVPESHTISDFSSLLSIPSNKHKKSQKSVVNNGTKISDQQQRNIKMLNTKLNFIHEDDTTISSSVFSSPEKKIVKKPSNSFAGELNKNLNIELVNTAGQLSPLSVDNINKLKIKSKSYLDTVNLERGNTTGDNNDFDMPQQLQLSNLELKRQKKDISSTSKTNSSSRAIQKSENLDFSQLLEDFNKSLSQVIEVNQQLKETLKKSNEMLSPNKKKIVNGTYTSSHREISEYTSDFEKEISQKNSENPYNDQNRYMDNKHLKRTGSIQSKTDEYTSDFEEEEPTSVEQKIEENITSNTNTSVKSEIILNIPQTKTSLIEKLQESISSSNTKITKKLLNENDYNNVQDEISINQSQNTNATEEFIDSIEESSNRKATASSSISEQITESIDKNKEIFENEKVEDEENSIHKNYCQNSKDHSAVNSVSKSKNEFIKNHINNSRGDFNIEQQNDDDLISNTITTTQQIENYTGGGPPPAYGMAPQENIPIKDSTNSTICSEFIAVFNRSDVELSMYSQNESSEATLNYSSIGMYEQLLQTETSKSDQLAALLKMREKALMDRTRGQIAWLEVQKEKYKSKGLSGQISHIKKKQRAILMKMEKEREEIKKLIQNQQTQASTTRCIVSDRQQQQKIRSYRPKLAENISDISIRKNFIKNSNITTTTTTATTKINSSNKIIRGFEIQSNQNLENILQKREEELRKRRAHVECLMEWHQRLDKEEQEVFQLERMLFEHNVVAAPSSEHQKQSKYQSELQAQSTSTSKQSDKLKNEKKIFEINKSLRELQNISSRSTDSTTGNQNPDYVRTTGNKLNKLWRRLTGQKHIEKFENTRKYKLYKNDLEKLYEEAKEEVLREFGNQQHEMMELFEQSKCIETTTAATSSLEDCSVDNQFIVPRLNLNFSSEQSYIDEEQTNCSSVFYKSTIQKQFQGIDNDLIKNIPDQSTSKLNNLRIDGILSPPQVNHQQFEQITKLHSEKLENHVEKLNSEKNTNKKPLDINNDLSTNQMFGENIENTKIETKIISEHPIEFDSLVKNNTTEKFISTDENNSPSTKIQITKITDISSENKTSDDITSLSLEEPNKSIENNSKSNIIDTNTSEDTKLNCSTETFSTSNTKIQSNIEISKVVDENIDILNQNIERVSVIVMPSKENSSENLFENIIKSPDSHIITNITDTESVITSPIEEITKFSDEEINSDISKITEKESPITSELIIETTNLENILENYSKSESIKSVEMEYPKDELFSERDILPEKSINSENFEAPTLLDNSKQLSESSHEHTSNETFILSEQNFSISPISINSTISATSHIITASELELQKTNIIEEIEEEYDNDFSGSSSDITYLEDITAPKFELTMEDTKSNCNDESNLLEEIDQSNNSTTELEKRLIDLDVSLKDLHNTFDRALSPDKNSITPPPSSLLSPPLSINLNKSTDDTTNIKYDLEKTKFSLSPRNYNITNNNDNATLMPDIINEVEIRRRQQILIESEIKQLEQTVPPYVFLREIPNKPPPPYVPPAHGSPMTIIFPSEQRIKEITFRRTKELYDEILKTDKNTDKNNATNSTTPPTLTISQSKSILDENITNIYERIILDICKECMQDYKEILTNLNPETYKSSLALFNPPDRLICMQEFVYRHVRKLLSMEKKSNTLQKNSVISIGRKKRDHVDEILIQELYEEENKWTNFDQEEEEVKLAIVDEILNNIVKDVIGEVTDINIKKLEFLTNYSSVNLNNDEEET